MPLYVRRDTKVGGDLNARPPTAPMPWEYIRHGRREACVGAALQPAFISREETTEFIRGMLGYFYRERPLLR
jgi:hypothetical protein